MMMQSTPKTGIEWRARECLNKTARPLWKVSAQLSNHYACSQGGQTLTIAHYTSISLQLMDNSTGLPHGGAPTMRDILAVGWIHSSSNDSSNCILRQVSDDELNRLIDWSLIANMSTRSDQSILTAQWLIADTQLTNYYETKWRNYLGLTQQQLDNSLADKTSDKCNKLISCLHNRIARSCQSCVVAYY